MVYASFILYVMVFALSLFFLISPTFVPSRMCFVTVSFLSKFICIYWIKRLMLSYGKDDIVHGCI